jgi:hypothetical protein
MAEGLMVRTTSQSLHLADEGLQQAACWSEVAALQVFPRASRDD